MSNFLGYRDGGKTNEQGLFQWLGKIFTKGNPIVDSSTSMQVVQRGDGANMSVDISIGDVSIADTSYNYYGWTDAVVNKTVTTSDPTNPRRDIVVAYVDKSVVSSASNNNPNALNFAVVAGTPAGSPSDPSGSTIQSAVGAGNPYVQLARISVAAAASSIVNANITDLRQPIALKARLWGGGSNTNGHTVPNAADDTVALLNATQTFNNKSFTSGSVNFDGIAGASALIYDFVESGCVWTADAVGSTLNASMSSGFVWIGGKRVTVASVSAHAFTASKDTYVYVDNTGTITYSPQTNNASSPSLPANSILLGIIISGASSISATTLTDGSLAAINQGSVYATLPIVSSVAYSVTDSLGNLINPRDPHRKIIGYRQFLSSQSGITTEADLTGLSVPINFTYTGRKITIEGLVNTANTVTDSYNVVRIKEGSTELGVSSHNSRSGNIPETCRPYYYGSPTVAQHIYKLTGTGNSSGSGSMTAAAQTTEPNLIVVRLD